jgi:hypothetical protein
VPAAHASESLADWNARFGSLEVNAKGEALITYTRANGRIRRALAWGAVNANHPDPAVPQVRFKYDYSGGWGKYRRLYWKTFRNACRPYDGPALVYLLAACKAPDGSYWAIQAWVRRQPLLGFAPWLPQHTATELHLSHWSGPLAQLDVFPNWTHGSSAQGIFGRLTYLGRPVHGFRTTRDGNPRDRYVRNVYIDTLNSAYGPGWKRESGIVTHRPTGTFCHSFVPQRPLAGYPDQRLRPAAPGERHRVTVMGPGVTPVIQWEGAAAARGHDAEYNAVFDQTMAGDRICAGER